MYATRADMEARFGLNEVVMLTDRNRSGQVDDSVLAGALADAAAEVDGFLAGRYPLPLTPAPRILTGYTCDIARYRLCGSSTLVSDDIRDRYRDAVRFLEHVASGKVSLGGMPSGEVAATSDNSVQLSSAGSVFSRDSGAY